MMWFAESLSEKKKRYCLFELRGLYEVAGEGEWRSKRYIEVKDGGKGGGLERFTGKRGKGSGRGRDRRRQSSVEAKPQPNEFNKPPFPGSSHPHCVPNNRPARKLTYSKILEPARSTID